jgi:hypothetical protein
MKGGSILSRVFPVSQKQMEKQVGYLWGGYQKVRKLG